MLLKGDEVINVQGYTFFVHNRKQLNKTAKRGSGGVGVLISGDILYRYTVEVIDSDVEDMMWVRMCSTQDKEARLLIYSSVTFLENHQVVVEMHKRRCSSYQSK